MFEKPFVAIIDDDEIKRESMQDEFVLADWTVTVFPGPFQKLDDLTQRVLRDANCAVCDHHFVRNYAAFNGAAAVAELYQRSFPAVLVTQYEVADMFEIRMYRRSIPVLLTPKEADPDTLFRAWEVCQNEFAGNFIPTRKPWKTLVRIADVSEDTVFVLLPGWNSDEVIRVPRRILPSTLSPLLQPGEHLFATVNKGAEDQSELFFENFEHRGK